MTTKCFICNGSGKYLNAGYLSVTCENCGGTGYIEEEERLADPNLQPIKNRGRPKKIITKQVINV